MQDGQVKKIGNNVIIYPFARIVNPQTVEIGDNTRIDDFVFINGGISTKIGRYVHIASFTSIIGGGSLEIGDCAALACGSRIITGTNTYKTGKRMSGSVPIEQQDVDRGRVLIGKDAFIGTNAVVLPNISIGEGAIIGSGSIVVNNVEPWTVNFGNPCRKMGVRPHLTVPDL